MGIGKEQELHLIPTYSLTKLPCSNCGYKYVGVGEGCSQLNYPINWLLCR